MKKNKLLAVIVMLCLCLGLAACGAGGPEKKAAENTEVQSEEQPEETSKAQTEVPSEGQPETEPASEAENGTDVLVVYFSATGTTKGVAERIAAAEGADTYEILAAEPYSAEDLDWGDSSSRTTKEQNDSSVRPEIGSGDINLSGYSKIYIGYPIWWGEEPRIMDTFVESHDFGDAVVIPFCTSQGSGIGRSGSNLAENAGSGNWKSGDRLQSSVSDADLQNWIDSFK